MFQGFSSREERRQDIDYNGHTMQFLVGNASQLCFIRKKIFC